MFEVIGLQVTASYYAEKALALPEDDKDILMVGNFLSKH